MDKDRIRRAALAADGTNYRRRMIAYAGTVALILGFLAWQASRPAPAPAALEDVAAPDEPRGVRESLAKVDPSLLAGVRDGTEVERALLEPGPTAHLVEQAGRLVYGDLEQMGLQAVPRAELVADPAAWRGRPVTVLGTLRALETVDDAAGTTRRGTLQDEHGEAWIFIVLSEPADVRPGDVVRVSGFFFKLHDYLAPDNSLVSGPLVVGQELLRSAWRIEPVTELSPELLARVRDTSLADASLPLESPEFYSLLSFVENAPDEALLGPDGRLQEVRASDLLQNSLIWRGRPVRVSGLLLAAEEVPLGLRGENPLGRPFIWNLWLSSYAGVCRVLSLEKPEGIEVRRDIVDADGVYFRRYSYENTKDQPRTAAVVVARHVHRYDPPKDTFTPLLVKAGIALVAVLGGLLWMAGRRDRLSGAMERQKRIERQKKLTRLPGRLTQGRDAPPPEQDGP